MRQLLRCRTLSGMLIRTLVASAGVLCVVLQHSEPPGFASSRRGASVENQTPRTAVVLELTIAQPGRETHKPRITVDVGNTAIAEFEGTGRLGLRPSPGQDSKTIAIMILDAAVKPMTELEEVQVSIKGRPVPVKSRPALSIAVLRTYDVK